MDLDRISELLRLLSEHDVNEFHYRDDEKSIRVKLGPVAAVAPVGVSHVVAHTAPAPAAAPVAAGPVAPAPEAGLRTIESPMVGTFYRSPKPGAPSFVEVGDAVAKGKVICIVEAMKLMNEIEAEISGTIVEICVENGHAVQFGQPLFKIRPG